MSCRSYIIHFSSHFHKYCYIRKLREIYSFSVVAFFRVALTCFTCWFLPSSLTATMTLSCFAVTFSGTQAVFTALIQTIKSIIPIGTSCLQLTWHFRFKFSNHDKYVDHYQIKVKVTFSTVQTLVARITAIQTSSICVVTLFLSDATATWL